MIQAQIQMEHVSGCAFKLSPDFCVFPFSQAVGALGGHWVTSVCHAVQLSCSLKLLWPSEHAFVGTRETELQQDTEKKGKVTFHGLSKLTTHLHSHTWMYHKCAFPHVILTQHWGQWWPLSRCSLQHLGSFWLEREHCFLERCCLSPGSYCVIFCFILHISAFLLVIVRANVSVCAFLCIHLFLLSVSPVTLSNSAPISWHSVAVTSLLHQQLKYLHEMYGPGGSCSWRHPRPKQGMTCQSTFTVGPHSVWDGEKRCVPYS